MSVVKVSPFLRAEKPLIWLCEKEGDMPRLLPIAVGEFEAAAVQMNLAGEQPLRPISYDLFTALLDELSIPVRRVVVHSVAGQIFEAVIVVEHESRLCDVDCRPSDGIALALRTQAPIFVTNEILDCASVSSAPDEAKVERTISRFYDLAQQILDSSSTVVEDEVSEPEAPSAEDDILTQLEHLLHQAVICEEYEEAALLRDKIERVKSTGS